MDTPTGTITATIVVSGKSIIEAELSSVFGVPPTRVWQAKRSVAAQAPELDKQEWLYRVFDQPCFSFSDAIDALIGPFSTNVDAIASYCQSRALEISVHVQPKGPPRGFILGFDRSTTAQILARLQACFYVHVENFTEDDSELDL